MSETITATRAVPQRTREQGVRQCARCGIEQVTKNTEPEYYCSPCRPLAVQLGWIKDPNTYTCTRCNKTVRGTGRDLCGNCKWNTELRKNK